MHAEKSMRLRDKIYLKLRSLSYFDKLRKLRYLMRTWSNALFWAMPHKVKPKPISAKIIVGLTASPDRIRHLKPVLKSILRQSYPPDEIHLNIPFVFKRNGTSYDIPQWLLEINPKIKLKRVEDVGPGTKVIPTLLELGSTEDVLVITADDDILMIPGTIEEIAKAFLQDPERLYGFSGYTLSEDFAPDYENKERPVDVLEGYAHFAVHRRFIDQDFADYIKAAHALRACYLQDDIVLANYFALKGRPRIQLYTPHANREVARHRGAILYYGMGADALHMGGGSDSYSDTYSAPFLTKTKEIAKFLGEKNLWALIPRS